MPFCCSTVEEEEPAIICSTRPGPQVARLVRDDHQGAGRATGMLEMDEVDAAMTMPTKPLKDYDDGFDSDSDEELYSDGTNLAELSIDLQIPAARAKPRNPPFKIWLKKRKNFINEELPSITMITILSKKSPVLANTLRNITNSALFYERDPSCPLSSLYLYMEQLRQYSHTPEVLLLVHQLEHQFESEQRKIKALVNDKQISFEYLWWLFAPGRFVVGFEQNEPVGSRISKVGYSFSPFGSVFTIEGEVVKSDGSQLHICNTSFRIYSFDDVQNISSLEVQLMSKPIRRRLIQRGRIFQTIATGAHYKQYSGNMLVTSGYSAHRLIPAQGRCMIDPQNFKRVNPNSSDFSSVGTSQHQMYDSNGNPVPAQGNLMTISRERLATTWPFIHGFSLKNKRWGQFRVEAISDIDFDSRAFDQLVMDPEKKSLVKALVEHHGAAFTDVIKGKGAGCIILLHGPPGTGKTLTAEAIADLLRRPLYTVSVGDLGTTPALLEEKLANILDLSEVWNAVLLVDEADVFLSERGDNIEKNAMTSVFLRLSEFFSGVLFLTTNRLTDFDKAFSSRVSVALEYDELDQSARAKVFGNLLEAAGLSCTGLDPARLAETSLNGRQIKSTIRLAQTLASSQGVPVSHEHFTKCVAITQQFDIADRLGKKSTGTAV